MGTIFREIDGKILKYNEATGEILVKISKEDLHAILENKAHNCTIQLRDNKPLSRRQRRFCYALLNDIAEWAGMQLEETKRVMKDKFLEDYVGDFDLEDFSLKDAPMELISSFQDFLVDFVLSYDIPTKADIKGSLSADKYVHMCIKSRKCCICGKDASLYTDHEGKTISVCGSHRIELLTGGSTFYEKYHIEPVFYVEDPPI